MSVEFFAEMVDFDHPFLACILGRQEGRRLKEIKRLAGVVIDVKTSEEDECIQKIKVRQAEDGNDLSVENAVWLMNICINAYGRGYNQKTSKKHKI